MGGGIFQLIAYGSQDVYLTGNPQITFFKAVYSRHSNFSIESVEQVFKGYPSFSNKISVTIGRNGDLLHNMILEVDISTEKGSPKFVNRPGFALINFVEIEIGGQVMDKHYGEWMDIWSQLSHSGEQFQKLEHMIDGNLNSNDTGNTKLYIPLQFWFNRNIGLALPLIALQYHEVKLNLYLNKEANIRKNHSNNNSNNAFRINNIKLFCDYIFLDTDERRRFAQVSHEYLIEQVQYNGKSILNYTLCETEIKLNLNHPCKELIWTAQSNMLIGKEMGGNSIEHYPFDFSRPNTADRQDMVLEQWTFNSTKYWVHRDIDNLEHIMYTDKLDRINTWAEFTLVGAVSADVPLDTDVYITKVVPMYRDNNGDQISYSSLELNGSDRFLKREGTYFRIVQPFQHHVGGFDHQRGQWYHNDTWTDETTTPNTEYVGPISKEKGYMCTYAFGFNPDKHQPSGTCNFSRIDNAVLRVGLNLPNKEIMSKMLEMNTVDPSHRRFDILRNNIPKDPVNTVKVYATNYNVLRITSGMGGLAYSN